MNKKSKLVEAVIEASSEIDGRKKLSCAAAFQLAGRFSVKVLEIGRVCNAKNIRICKCQLGCFK